MSIQSVLSNRKFAHFTKSVAAAVYVTTAIKAIGRPAFIYYDKNSDKETKKYTAGKEFLYQLLCLGLTFAMVKPAEWGSFKLAKHFLEGRSQLKGIKKFSDFKHVAKDLDELTNEARQIVDEEHLSPKSKKALKKVSGAVQLGSFVASILGLTIIAPLISHEILHPIMKALGMEKPAKLDPLDTSEERFAVAKENKLDKKA